MPTAEHRSPETMDVRTLIAHIAAGYQQVHRKVLPELVELARKVERVHHDVPEAPIGLADALERIALALDLHMQEEEKVLFTAMRQGIGSAMVHPISVMRAEHEGYATELDGIAEIAHGFVAPEGACGSWRRLYAGVADLDATLREQIRLEDKVLFPRFEVQAQTRCTCAHA